MKKSFMTRVLAAGLSFAMAFSMAAATNVTTASAASKPKMITSSGASAKSLDVKLGEAVKIKVNAATKKTYKVSAAKVSSSKLRAAVNKAGTVVTIRGLKATEEGKPASVKVSFKVKKTGKASKYSYVSKVNVIDEKLTMTAAATAVKEITLTFNKAVADTTAAKIVVKKGNAAPTFTAKWADDKKSVVLAMDSKLTKGTYDVTVSGVEKTDLIASVTVEDQKLTSFELVSTNLVANATPISYGSIQFKALDQYSKPMKTTDVTITSSFGKLGTYNESTKTFSATANNTVSSVKDDVNEVWFEITPALAILGTKGTITIVGKNGTNLSSEITLVSPAKASKVEYLGIYNTTKGKYMDMTAGDKITDYAIALKFYDQYNQEVKATDTIRLGAITASVAAGTTAIKSADYSVTSTKIDDKDVAIIQLDYASANVAKEGNVQVIVVNTGVGLLDTLKFDVAAGTVIKSFSVSADNDIYAGEEVELSYSAIDADGNEVTKYDVLSKAIPAAGLPNYTSWKKQADGSAKLIYKDNVYAGNTTDYKESKSVVLTFTVYPGEANIIVYNATAKVNQPRVIWEVNGIDSSKAIATTTGVKLSFKPTDLKVSDQYGNTLTKSQIESAWSRNQVAVAKDGTNDWNITTGISGADTAFEITPGTDATAKFKLTAGTLGNPSHVDDGYTLTLSLVDATKATDFAIEWKNDGLNVFSVSNGALTLNKDDQFQVVGKVAGKKVIIPQAQYEIVSGGSQNQVKVEAGKDRIKKEATLTIVVDDEEHKSNTITATYTYSNENPKLAKISAAKTVDPVAKDKATIADFVQDDADDGNAFKLLDQYGAIIAEPSDLVANITILDGDGYVQFNGTNKATVCDKSASEKVKKISVTVTCGDLTATKEIDVTH